MGSHLGYCSTLAESRRRVVKRDTTTDLDDEGRRGLQQIKRAQNAREGGGGGKGAWEARGDGWGKSKLSKQECRMEGGGGCRGD